VRVPKAGSASLWATTFAYDQHVERLPACPERGGGSRRCLRGGGPDPDLGHDAEDQPTQQVDDFGTTGSTADDEQLSWEYSPTGLETKRTLAKNAGTPTTWTNEQVSTRTYFANGLLKTLTTTDGAATPVTVQDHSLSYEAGGVYVNGNRARDVFTLLGPDAAAPCRASTCTASWGYDARERVLQEVNGTGGVTDFTLDVVGNVSQEKQNGAVARTASCSAQQLASETVSGTTKRYLYDPSGHVDCVTANGWASAACPGAGDGNLLVDYGYDYKNRLAA